MTMIDETVLRREEEAKLRLRALYRNYGYMPFKMSKFEEYDLYARNKDFLISDSVITFTDTDGKLMALKPDVTLSIIKNSRTQPGQTRKMCYDENVYRISDSTHAYREIPQVGLECIGTIDGYQQSEVVYLAARSLAELSRDYLIDVSHLRMLAGALTLVPGELHRHVLLAFAEKNADAIRAMNAKSEISETAADTLIGLLSCDGMLTEVLPTLPALCVNDTMREALQELCELASALACDEDILSHLRLDFSVVNNMKYYSGIVFQGFVQGIPTSVLSGGRYDYLMRRMGQSADAIGFAVYPELLQRLADDNTAAYDADVLLLYCTEDDPAAVCRAVRTLTEAGERVLTAHERPEKMTFRRTVRIAQGGIIADETHD